VSLQSSVELWSGNVSDKNKALQLLWIVDIIKFWAEYTYKPMIGACLARLKAPTDELDEVPLEETLWKSHIVLNEETTPWFFHQANYPPGKKTQPRNVSTGNDRPKLKPKSLSDPCSPWLSETAPNQILHRRPTLNEQQIDDFTWLQDGDTGNGDLLVVRLGREGKIDKPLILLEYSNSDHSPRYSGKLPSHAGVDVGLMWGEGGVHLLRQQREFFSSDHQFCAILPLKPKVYQGQRRKPRESSIFEPLEELLDLDGFYRIYDLEYTSDGDRRRPQVEDHSDIAIDDEDNAESDQGTYNEVTSDDEADIRSDADGSSDDVEEEEEEEGESTVNDHEESTSDEDELDTPEKSHQRLDSVHTAWKNHHWPKSAAQGKAFARIAIRLDLAKTIAYKVKDIKMYSGGEKLPIDWMTPVKGFGKSYLRVQKTEKRDSPTSESSDNQLYEGSDPDQTLVDSGDMGKEAISELGRKFNFLGGK